MSRRPPSGPGGLLIVDKAAGMTSHDVVARVRRLSGTRRVGHAGTLDPMATGVLVLGVERATKLLNHLVLTDKTYEATIRLGRSTTTDDAEGDVLSESDAGALEESAVRTAMSSLTGEVQQRPSSVSAIKVDGRRAYALVRAGESVELASRPISVHRFEPASGLRTAGRAVDVDVVVECSSGTYVRALARDLGELLGVGGHLTALRRTRVGPFGIADALTLEALAHRTDPVMLPLPSAIAASMPTRAVTDEQARELSFGRSIDAVGIAVVYGALDASGVAVALLSESDGRARPVLGFTPAG
jgi:tRNA pseudouridine55 synthase